MTRVALVTGASGGTGRVVAVRLAQAGMAVAVHYAGNRERIIGGQARADWVHSVCRYQRCCRRHDADPDNRAAWPRHHR